MFQCVEKLLEKTGAPLPPAVILLAVVVVIITLVVSQASAGGTSTFSSSTAASSAPRRPSPRLSTSALACALMVRLFPLCCNVRVV